MFDLVGLDFDFDLDPPFYFLKENLYFLAFLPVTNLSIVYDGKYGLVDSFKDIR